MNAEQNKFRFIESKLYRHTMSLRLVLQYNTGPKIWHSQEGLHLGIYIYFEVYHRQLTYYISSCQDRTTKINVIFGKCPGRVNFPIIYVYFNVGYILSL